MDKLSLKKYEIEGYERTERMVKAGGGLGFSYIQVPARYKNKRVMVILLDEV